MCAFVSVSHNVFSVAPRKSLKPFSGWQLEHCLSCVATVNAGEKQQISAMASPKSKLKKSALTGERTKKLLSLGIVQLKTGPPMDMANTLSDQHLWRKKFLGQSQEQRLLIDRRIEKRANCLLWKKC